MGAAAELLAKFVLSSRTFVSCLLPVLDQPDGRLQLKHVLITRAIDG